MHHADLVGGLAARMEGVKRIVWGIHMRDVFRSPGDGDFKIAMFKTALRAASRSIPKLIVSCSTTAMSDHQRSLGYPGKKMAFIANGISTSRFVPDAAAGARMRNELGIPLDAPVIGFVGRFHPIKNLALFFEAAALLQKKMPHAHIVICGGRPADLDPHASRAYHALQDREAVHFLPFRFDMERLYPAFSLLTLCSQSEALPMVVLEAMACGVPCVTTDVGDCREVIADTGRVVPANDAAALAAGWEAMLSMPSAERNALSQKARQRVEAHFSLQHAAHQYQTAYAGLLHA
jgi:glycosyltransferase involved in cell wall biosynthesis